MAEPFLPAQARAVVIAAASSAAFDISLLRDGVVADEGHASNVLGGPCQIAPSRVQ